jgi:hypothetical protein
MFVNAIEMGYDTVIKVIVSTGDWWSEAAVVSTSVAVAAVAVAGRDRLKCWLYIVVGMAIYYCCST